ncbi:MAG: hypothetical protein VKO44_04350 [Cyanobacteriota bacterium]|jgi:hypothetical protein|nr:hypothetical protein [Cyanobacteriota bacterium]
MPSTNLSRDLTLLVTTCLRWTADGELSAEDRSQLLLRLMQIDPCWAEGLCH